MERNNGQLSIMQILGGARPVVSYQVLINHMLCFSATLPESALTGSIQTLKIRTQDRHSVALSSPLLQEGWLGRRQQREEASLCKENC